MRQTISRRIDKLESVVAKTRTAQPTELFSEDSGDDLCARWSLTAYEPKDREALLTLEERLAIARRDAIPKPEAWEDRWHPQLGRVVSQRVPVDTRPGRAARELEIRILERDGKIDVDGARRLRKNRHAHFFAEPFGSVELLELPCPIVIADEEAVANEALRKCPLFESRPLEEQLKIREDELSELRRQASIQHPPGSMEEICAGLRSASIERDEQQIAELRQRIVERDRGSRPLQKNTSATA